MSVDGKISNDPPASNLTGLVMAGVQGGVNVSVPGTLFQPIDADLTAIAALGTQTYGRSLLTLANATALSGELASFYQPLDSDLTAIAALTTAAYGRSLLTLASSTALSGELSAFYQPLDADLTSWAAVTRASGFDAFVATPSSANLATLLTDETGSGALVFATSPALTTPTVTTRIEPTTDDGAPLGSTTKEWSDLFLASGGVINWANGNYTLTHSTGLLTTSGPITVTGALNPGANNTYSLGTTATLQWQNLFLGSGSSVNWVNGNVTLTHGTLGRLLLTGSLGRGAPVTKTSNFSLADTENWVVVSQASTTTVTFPAASSYTGREVTIKTNQAQTVVSASSNVVPLVGGAAGTAILAATAGKYATLVSDGTNWLIMAAN